MKKLLFITLVLAFTSQANDWKQNIEEWKTARVASLTKPHGWLSLIGMEWFHNGKNTIGSAPDNAIVLPHGPKYIGVFNLLKEKITFTVNKGVTIEANNETVEETIDVEMDSSGSPTVFTIDTFQFYVIQRGKPALRIKDSTATIREEFSGINYFPVTKDFKIEAEFVAYKPAKEIEIINVLGLLSKEKSLGKLVFKVNGKSHQLDTMDAGDEYYILFADRTSGRTTYGPGRFLYVPKPKEGTKVTIDFNMAYNPPCAFNDYSTCPLPPPQNRISAFIEAGEKKYKK